MNTDPPTTNHWFAELLRALVAIVAIATAWMGGTYHGMAKVFTEIQHIQYEKRIRAISNTPGFPARPIPKGWVAIDENGE